jgi:hypothetical protein
MIRNFIQRLYPTKRHRLSLLGLGGAGKTTLLYQLKLQKVVQTIPTIGFNVEDVDVRTTSGVFSTTCWDLGTGCGTTYMVPLLKNMVSTSDGVVWLVDSADESYLEASVDAFKTIFAGSDGLAMDMPILMYVALPSECIRILIVIGYCQSCDQERSAKHCFRRRYSNYICRGIKRQALIRCQLVADTGSNDEQGDSNSFWLDAVDAQIIPF